MATYSVPDTALPTRELADKHVLRGCVAQIAIRAQGPTWIEFTTTALVKAKSALSSADSAMALQLGLKEGSPVTGVLRLDVIGDHAIRVRHMRGKQVPTNATPMVIGALAPPTTCTFHDGLTADAGMRAAAWINGLPATQTARDAAVAFDTPAMRVLIMLDPFRIELRRHDGTVICGIGGNEKDHFCNWDAYPTGISQRRDGRAVAHESFDLRPGHCVYGLGERFTRLDLVGQTVELWHRDGLGTTTARSYKNVPFFVTTMGWGAYFNHSSAGTAWIGSMSACDVQLAFDDDMLDYTVFTGSIAEVLAQYTTLTGRSPMPPEWTFGFWQSKISYRSAEETLDIARRYRTAGIPSDVIHLDTHWFKADWYCDLEFDRERFPDPAGYLAELKKLGFHVSLWQLPYIPEGSAYYAELLAVDGFVKRPDGSIHNTGICFTPGFTGTVGLIDFTNPQAVAVFQRHLRRLFALGAAVVKTDFGEDAPADGVWHDGTPAHRMHNLYPLLYNEAAAAVTPGGAVWHRSAWAGGQRHPVPWGGDNSPNIHNLGPQWCGGLSLGLCGYTFWSEDIGGFTTDTNDHLLIRWMQGGLLHSHARIHGSGIRELDRFAPTTTATCRSMLELRYRLLPYILAQSRACAAAGQPTMRALVLDFQADRNTWRIDDQWCFGRDLLVAPIMDLGQTREVYLPPGTWFDWWTRQPIVGGRWITATAPLDRIPMWLRSGALVPLGDIHQSVSDVPDAAIELLVTPLDADGERDLAFVVNGTPVTARLTCSHGRHTLSVTGCPIPLQTVWLGNGPLSR